MIVAVEGALTGDLDQLIDVFFDPYKYTSDFLAIAMLELLCRIANRQMSRGITKGRSG